MSKNQNNSNNIAEYKSKFKNNFVVKHDYNRSSIHRDLKNDYNRSDNREYLDEESDFYLDDQEEI